MKLTEVKKIISDLDYNIDIEAIEVFALTNNYKNYEKVFIKINTYIENNKAVILELLNFAKNNKVVIKVYFFGWHTISINEKTFENFFLNFNYKGYYLETKDLSKDKQQKYLVSYYNQFQTTLKDIYLQILLQSKFD